VSSGKFKAAHRQKYEEPINFHQAHWNKVGPSVGSMKIMLKMMWTKFEGESAGLKADLTNYPQCLIGFLIKEAREAITFLDLISTQLAQYKEAVAKEKDANEESDAFPPDKAVKLIKASKTQGTVPGAPEVPPAEGTATNTINMAEGDKGGPQSVSMAPGG
jgi:hypothetical protein